MEFLFEEVQQPSAAQDFKLRNEETSTPQKVSFWNAQQLLIHFEPRGREKKIGKKYITALI